MFVLILGAAAGGGFPQWNSAAPGCLRARAGDPAAKPRTQASVAVSGDGQAWVLLNASPDLRQQIEANPDLHPRHRPRLGPRSSPIGAVVLSNGDVDAMAGLLTLRERHRFAIFGTAPVMDVLVANSLFGVLSPDLVARRTVAPGAPFDLPGGLRATLFPVPGKVPLYAEATDAEPPLVADGRTVGVEIVQDGARVAFVPSCGGMTPQVAARLDGADLVLFDATLWRDDEMQRLGIGRKTGRRMGHMSLSGPQGTLAAFGALRVGRKVLIHINNTNPILLDDSPEAAEVRALGWAIGEDGMRFELP